MKDANAEVQYWLDHIASYEKEAKKWEARVDKILRKYKDEFRQGNRGFNESRYNILWANVQTLVPAVYNRLPQPDVSRRFRDQDPVGRVASMIVERALDYEIQHYAFYRDTLKACVYDRFLGGRGTAWVRYEPKFKEGPEPPTEPENAESGVPQGDQAQITEDVVSQDILDYECSPVDYINWKDFGHTVVRTWEEVTAVWRKVYLTRKACIDRFGEELGKEIPLDAKPQDKKQQDYTNDNAARALVYEIWDKEAKEVIWLSKSLNKVLDERPDPLKLENFWPCPKPLYSTITTDSLIPVPDYSLYQDQANTLDTLSDRIEGLINALKVRGVYNGEFIELSRLFTEGENNTLIPVKAWNAFAEKQGLKGAIDLVDIQPIAFALKEAYAAMAQVKQQVYDITGISDIIRGATEASETATAQQIKGQYASIRLRSMQEDVARFATELLQIMAQIMCGQYEPKTLMEISAVQQLSQQDQALVTPAMQLLIGPERAQNPEAESPNPLRSFRIEIAADTLVQLDEQQEKKDRMEFLQATGAFLKEANVAGQQNPVIVPLLMDMLKFGVTGFKVGKQIEGSFDETTEKLKQAAAQPKQPPPDPKLIAIQAGAQADAQALQQKTQAEQADRQQEAQLRMQEINAEAQHTQQQNALEAQRNQQQAMMDAQMAQFEALLDAKVKLMVAEISAKATLDSAQVSAADQGAAS